MCFSSSYCDNQTDSSKGAAGKAPFSRGDHVERWFAGAVHHHAIVLYSWWCMDDKEWKILTADFWRNPDIKIGSSRFGCCMGTVVSGASHLKKVWYTSVSHWKKSWYTRGKCFDEKKILPSEEVCLRALFLLQHPENLPSYNLFVSNCECAAVWCKSGAWCSIQANSASVFGTFALGAATVIAVVASSPLATALLPFMGMTAPAFSLIEDKRYEITM